MLLSLQPGAAQFVELTVELAFDDWDYRFFEDRIGKYAGRVNPPSIFTKTGALRCVVGTNTWMIETVNNPGNGKTTRWFTGTNLVEHTALTNIGHRVTRVYDSADGNPGRPERVADLMAFDIGSKISWLALCSGSFLKSEGRKIYPPSDFWKESQLVYSGWSDETSTFKDSFGLPKSINLLATNNQPVFRYQARGSTNVSGGNFPLEFYCVQYWPRSHSWEMHWTAKGRVIAIGEGTKPEISAKVVKAVEK